MLISRLVVNLENEEVGALGVRQWSRTRIAAPELHGRDGAEAVLWVGDPGCSGFDGFPVQHVGKRRAMQAARMQKCWLFSQGLPLLVQAALMFSPHLCLLLSLPFSFLFTPFLQPLLCLLAHLLICSHLSCFSLVSPFDTIFVLGCAIYIF